MKYYPVLFLVMLMIVCVGCSPFVDAVQTSQTELIRLDAQNPVGQTFVARYDGLQAVQVYLSPQQAGSGEIYLHLKTDVGSAQDLRKMVLPLDQVTEAKSYRFDFPLIEDSNGQYYYAVLEIHGDGILAAGASAGSTYLDGALYQQGAPRDGQLVFNLVYEPGDLALGLMTEMFYWVYLFGVAGLFYAVPGWTFLGWLWPGWGRLSWFEKLGLSVGFGLAFFALLLLYTDLIGLHLGAGYAWGSLILGLGAIVRRGLRDGSWKKQSGAFILSVKQPIRVFEGRLPDLALVGLLGLIIITRWWAVREIEAPMWGDSVQHTVITQLILDHDGLFESWEPYTPYGSFSNQFGFPTASAVLAWVSGLDTSRAVLWAGQILNGLAVIAIYPLAIRLVKGQRWAGVGAVLVSGLISPMPAFYVNWGRYAQLAGQVILPVALWMLWDIVEEHRDGPKGFQAKGLPWGKIGLAGATLGGLVIHSYRSPFFYLTFILAWVVGWWLPAWRLDARRWIQMGIKVGLVAMIGMVLFLPWGIRMYIADVSKFTVRDVAQEVMWADIRADYQTWKDIFLNIPKGLVIVATTGWIWACIRRQWTVVAVGWWVLWLASVYAWTGLGVPGANQVAPFTVQISLYIPAGLLIGWLIGEAANLILRWKVAEILLVLVVISLGGRFAWGQRHIAEPETFAMVTRPDMRAMTWIREQTNPEAIFLVEGFRAFYNTAAVGSDAGWWIPLLAERDNTMPPLYALSGEVPTIEGYSAQVVELVADLETTPLNTSEGVKLLCDQEISHVYIGQRQGLVGLSWLAQLFTPDELVDVQSYEQVYHQDRVYIFALREDVCNE